MPECCSTCPAAVPNAPTAGIELESNKRPVNKECKCRSCCCGKPQIVKPCYRQPRVPDSFAPRRCYVKPNAPIDAGTTYNMSFLPVNCKNLRMPSVRPTSNFQPSTEPMEGCSVQRLSYLPNPICPAPEQFRPCNHDMWGRGPMQNITTQRHDFVPKPSVMRENYKPIAKYEANDQPFENRTVNKLSYLPPDRFVQTKSYAPVQCYSKPTAKMDGATTQKLSYLPNQILPKEIHPWAGKSVYHKPETKLDGNTTYTLSYLDAQSDCRRKAIIPCAGTNPVTASTNFDTQTVYKNSYLPAKADIPTPIKPSPNIIASDAPMDGDTVHKLSFLPNPICPAPEQFRPCNHDMWGRGPMQNITTQRHDFVPKPSVQRENFKPISKYEANDQPFETRTVNRLSFLDPGRIPKPANYAPQRSYEKPSAKMDLYTTQKMSYLPVQVPQPERPPWASRGKAYQRPETKVDCTTVYKSSFLPPGEDCTEIIDPCEYGDCNPCECQCPAECITTDPCACALPNTTCCK